MLIKKYLLSSHICILLLLLYFEKVNVVDLNFCIQYNSQIYRGRVFLLTLPYYYIEQDQKDLLNLPLCRVMNCYINFSHCEGQNLTEFQSSKMAVVVLPQLTSTCLNRELRSSNRVKPSRLGLNLPQLQVEVIQ